MHLEKNLNLPRCPHCSIAKPHLVHRASIDTEDQSGILERKWIAYVCASCGGVVTAWAFGHGDAVIEHFPSAGEVDSSIPERPREYLRQARESLHAPAGAIMLAASAVDAMLKLKGYTKGSLYSRIESAVTDHLITADMALWAHQVRLDANDQRHADEGATLPSEEEAKRVLDFTTALADFLFVLTARVTSGISESK
jgi:hypothetical protein